MPQQLRQILPRPGAAPDSAPADTLELTRVGRAAERILSDSLHTLPAQFDAWATGAYAALLRLLPRLLLAVAVAAVLLALTVWVRGRLRRRRPPDGTRAAWETTIGVIGVLVAVATAAAIAGAPTVAAACVAFLVFYVPASLLRAFGAQALRRSSAAPEAVELVLTIARYALIALGTVEALGALGLRVGGVLAGLGIIGIALGFAAQDMLTNVIAGFTILWDRPLRVGDWVRIGEHEGRVKQITLRSTRIETRDDGILVLPNREVTSGRVYNFSLRHLTRVRVPVDVAYDADVELARRLMLGALPVHEAISSRPEPAVATTSFGERGIRLELVLFIVDPREAMPLHWALNEAVFAALRAHDVALAYPHLHVHLRGDEVAVPGVGERGG